MALAIAETSPTVKVESPGTHYFSKDQVPDMQHLIQLLLVKAGYTEPLVWTLKFVEKQKAGQETPPLSFTGGVKLWGIPIKVKPSHGDNWCHAMTLLLPDKSGLKAETVLHNLKHHVKSINRNWRQEYKTRFRVITAIEKLELPITEPEPPRVSVGDKVGYVKPPEEVILPITVKEEPVKEPARSQPEPLNFKRPNFIDLQKIDQNSEKIKFVLSKCLEIETTHITRSPQDYRDRLMELCEWQEFGNRSAGKALSSLVSNEYLQELRGDRNKHIGYVLTPKSKRLIGVHCETLEPLHKRPEQPKAPEPPPDYKPLVRSLRAKADEVSNACRRLADREEYLETLKQQRQEIDQKISEAEKEIEHLVSVVVPNQEVAVALSRFAAQPVAYKDPS